MDPKDYYSILGVSTNSTEAQIKKAYRDLALKYHPDRNKSLWATEMMKKINEAYDVLSDKQKRFDYDHRNDSVAVGYSFNDIYETYSKYSDYVKEKKNSNNKSHSSYYYNNKNNGYYNFSNQDKQNDYSNNKVSVWWQMLLSLIPLINFVVFFRIQRLEMATSSLLPILVGISILLTIMPEYPFFPLRYEDRFNLFLLLFGGALVFFARRWSVKWNDQIKKGQKPSGDNIDKKVNLITQLLLSVIPFVNLAAFARIYHFQRSLIIGIPNYILMAFVALGITYANNNPSLFYPAYLILTTPVFIVFMYRCTIRYNLGKYYS
jgi:curved DNA-binding protein CbpA